MLVVSTDKVMAFDIWFSVNKTPVFREPKPVFSAVPQSP